MKLFEKSPLVTSKSITKMIQNSYYKQLIKKLTDSKKIYRIAKGKYSRFNDPSLFVFAVTPSYLGLQDAMSIHDLWSQETTPIIITSKKIRSGIRNIMNSNILVRRIDRRYLFGFEYINFGEYYLPYSDLEKTFIDLVYFNEKIDDEAINKFKNRLNYKKVKKYLRKYPKKIQNKCLSPLK